MRHPSCRDITTSCCVQSTRPQSNFFVLFMVSLRLIAENRVFPFVYFHLLESVGVYSFTFKVLIGLPDRQIYPLFTST
jgi:hypothetical protein